MPAVLSAPCVAADLSPLRRHDSPARAANILIDMAQNRIIVRIIRSTEGAVMRRHASGIECGARGRGMNARPGAVWTLRWSAERRAPVVTGARAARRGDYRTGRLVL